LPVLLSLIPITPRSLRLTAIAANIATKISP
jgi:hypothetical protein